MRISDWSSDVCSSDLSAGQQTIFRNTRCRRKSGRRTEWLFSKMADRHTIALKRKESGMATISKTNGLVGGTLASDIHHRLREDIVSRSEEHTSELQSLMRLSYAVFCLTNHTPHNKH